MKLNSSSPDRYSPSLPVVWFEGMSHFNGSYSVQIIERIGLRYGPDSNTDYATTRHSLWVVASFCSVLVYLRHGYPISWEVWSSCCFSNTKLAWEAHGSGSNADHTARRGVDKIGQFLSTFFMLCTAFFSVGVRRRSEQSWYLLTVLFSAAEAPERFGTKRRITSRKSKVRSHPYQKLGVRELAHDGSYRLR